MGCLCHLEDRVLIAAANHRAPQRLSGLKIGFDHLHSSLLVIGVIALPEADIKRGTFAAYSLLVSHTLVCDKCPAPGIDVCNLEQLITSTHEQWKDVHEQVLDVFKPPHCQLRPGRHHLVSDSAHHSYTNIHVSTDGGKYLLDLHLNEVL